MIIKPEDWHDIFTSEKDIAKVIDHLRTTGAIDEYPELAALDGLEQDPLWHPEGDVLTHLGLAANVAASIADEVGLVGDDRYTVVAATMLHDVGKATTSQHRIEQDGSVRIVSPGHAEAGAEPTESFLQTIGCQEHLQRKIVPLVVNHMATCPTERASRRLANRLAPATLEDWAIVTQADRLGRGKTSIGTRTI